VCLGMAETRIIPRPKIVTTATTDTNASQMFWRIFFESCTKENPDIMTLSSALVQDLHTWADGSGLQKTRNTFIDDFSKILKGIIKKSMTKAGNLLRWN